MKTSRHRPAVHFVGPMVVIAVLALVGCERKSEPAASTPSGESASSAEYSVPAPAGDQSTPAAASLKVTVSLSPAMAKPAAPTDTVFIFARAVNGPRMPLAIVRKQVKDLPATVVLDDSVAMNPAMKLSSVPEVIVVARVSKSGGAIVQADDLEGASGPVKTGTGTVTINIANAVTGQ